MANLRDKLCSSRRKTCKDKQRIRRTEIIRQFSQDGKQMKNTENRWDFLVSDRKKSCFTTKLLVRHDFSATKAERTKNSKHWVISMNAEGPQLP